MTAPVVSAYGPSWPPDPTRQVFPAPAQIAVAPFEEFCVTNQDVHEFFEPYGEWQALAYDPRLWKEEEPAC